MRPVKLAVVLYTVSAAILLILFALDPRGAHAQERDAFDVDIIPAASKHLGVVHEWGFERVDVGELVALSAEKRGQGRAHEKKRPPTRSIASHVTDQEAPEPRRSQM